MGASSLLRRYVANRWALVAVTIVVVAGVGARGQWLRLQDRREIAGILKLTPAESASAPLAFRVFGEPGYSEIELLINAEPGTERARYAKSQLERVRRAFPEAQITTKPALGLPWQERYRGNANR